MQPCDALPGWTRFPSSPSVYQLHLPPHCLTAPSLHVAHLCLGHSLTEACTVDGLEPSFLYIAMENIAEQTRTPAVPQRRLT